MLCHCIDKAVAGIRVALPARFQYMAQQEQSGQRKAVMEILVRPAIRAARAMLQERRQA